MTIESPTFDFSLAPFRIDAGADSLQVAHELITCFRTVLRLPHKVPQSFRAAMKVIGCSEENALYQAGDRIAREIDAGVGAGEANPYHNAQHFCEVLLGALCLSLLSELKQGEQARLLVAALIHDFHHDGKLNGDVPFRLERLAIEAATPHLVAAGVKEEERLHLAAMVLATEVSVGARFARRCYLHFCGRAAKPEMHSLDPVLRQLAGDAGLARQAVLLTEADVLASVGLTVEYGELQQEKLSREWNRSLQATDKLHFLEQVFEDFTISHFFSPNLRRLKQAMHKQLSLNAD